MDNLFSHTIIPSRNLWMAFRDEQYRLAWEELEQHIRNYSHLSVNHFSLLNCLLQCQGKTSEIYTQQANETHSSKRHVTIEDEHKGFVVVSESNIKDSPISPGSGEPAIKKSKPNFPSAAPSSMTFEKINLLKFWIENFEKEKWKRWKDFDRRAEASGNKVELYPDLQLKLQEQQKEISASTTS